MLVIALEFKSELELGIQLGLGLGLGLGLMRLHMLFCCKGLSISWVYCIFKILVSLYIIPASGFFNGSEELPKSSFNISLIGSMYFLFPKMCLYIYFEG